MRLAEHGRREAQALAHPQRVAADPPVSGGGEADQLEQRVDPCRVQLGGAITRWGCANVVWRTRVQQDDDAAVAADLGVGLRTLQRRRQRAERQLATAS